MYSNNNDQLLKNGQIRFSTPVLNSIEKAPAKDPLYVTHIGYFPNAQLHYRKWEKCCDDYILIYCVAGKGSCETQNATFTLQCNQFILLPPKQYYSYQPSIEHPSTIYCVHFNGTIINELNAHLQLKKHATPIDLPLNDQIVESWKEIYSGLLGGYTNENTGFASLCLYRFFSFFLFPYHQAKAIPPVEIEDAVDQSILFMKANIHKRLTVDELAAQFNYSPSRYTVLFKQKTGLSPMDYLIKIKIDKACNLLMRSNLFVKEIAGKVGYDDPYYFSRLFKKVMGKTPLEHKCGEKMIASELLQFTTNNLELKSA